MQFDKNKIFNTVFFIAIFVVAYALSLYKIHTDELEKQRILLEHQQIKIDTFKDISLQAQSALVIDLSTQEILYGFHEHDIRPLASITKIMTALIASDTLDPKETVTITPNALKEEGENNLALNEVWNSRDLIQFMLVVSSNDAADALAETVDQKYTKNASIDTSFIATMNRVANTIGMKDTHFYNPNGLDLDSQHPSAVGTAVDVATMAYYAYTHDPLLFSSTTKNNAQFVSKSGFTHDVKNTNTIVEDLPGTVLSKTGFTDLAGGNLCIVTIINGRPYALVVLGSTDVGRLTDMSLLFEKTRQLVTSGVYWN
jgi:serine-type D-Ala-D-Ala carboxypeptidase (penicillin-binding protein 5/6)